MLLLALVAAASPANSRWVVIDTSAEVTADNWMVGEGGSLSGYVDATTFRRTTFLLCLLHHPLPQHAHHSNPLP